MLYDPPEEGAKVLIYDIETAPILASVWKIFDENIGLEQIEKDWHVISWSAKWLNDPPEKIMYMDQRKARDIENDKKILEGIWELIDQADVVITHNGKSFDQPKLNARFIKHKMHPPAMPRHIDTYQIARSKFRFTSNKLAYLCEYLGVEHKKSEHKKFSGFKLWKECLNGNQEAWQEMEDYNKLDVLSLQDVYKRLAPWSNQINFQVYRKDSKDFVCQCGSMKFRSKGYNYTNTGAFSRFYCLDCGAHHHKRVNSLSPEDRKKLRKAST
jgi:DNA polymerase elongation subunit (family B)